MNRKSAPVTDDLRRWRPRPLDTEKQRQAHERDRETLTARVLKWSLLVFDVRKADLVEDIRKVRRLRDPDIARMRVADIQAALDIMDRRAERAKRMARGNDERGERESLSWAIDSVVEDYVFHRRCEMGDTTQHAGKEAARRLDDVCRALERYHAISKGSPKQDLVARTAVNAIVDDHAAPTGGKSRASNRAVIQNLLFPRDNKREDETDWRDELLSVRDAHLRSAMTIEGSMEGRTVTARSSALEICARGLCDMLRQHLGPEIILAIARYERVGFSVGDGRKGYLAREIREWAETFDEYATNGIGGAAFVTAFSVECRTAARRIKAQLNAEMADRVAIVERAIHWRRSGGTDISAFAAAPPSRRFVARSHEEARAIKDALASGESPRLLTTGAT